MRPTTIGVWLAGTLAVFAFTLTHASNAYLVLPVAWMAMFLSRGLLAPLLVPLYFPGTVELGLPYLTPTLLYFFAIGSALLYALRFGPGRTWRFSGWLVPLLAVVAFVGIGTGTPLADVTNALRPLLAMVALAYVYSRGAAEAPDAFRRVMGIAVWVGAAVGVLAAYQTLTDTWPLLDTYASGPQYTSARFYGRPGGTMGHPILLGAVLVAMTVAGVVLRPKGWRLAVGLCLLGVALSGSRSAYAATAAALLVMLLAQRTNRRLSVTQVVGFAGFGIFALSIAAAANDGVAMRLTQLAERLSLTDDLSAAGRGARISIAWDQITMSASNFLVGQGPGADSRYILSQGIGDKTSLTFDNFYLILWFNYGLVGVLVLLAALAAIWRNGGVLARPMVAAVGVEMLFFDATGWMSMLALIALAAGAASLDQRTSEVAAADALTVESSPTGQVVRI